VKFTYGSNCARLLLCTMRVRAEPSSTRPHNVESRDISTVKLLLLGLHITYPRGIPTDISTIASASRRLAATAPPVRSRACRPDFSAVWIIFDVISFQDLQGCTTHGFQVLLRLSFPFFFQAELSEQVCVYGSFLKAIHPWFIIIWGCVNTTPEARYARIGQKHPFTERFFPSCENLHKITTISSKLSAQYSILKVPTSLAWTQKALRFNPLLSAVRQCLLQKGLAN
jgi:hypothetical protein